MQHRSDFAGRSRAVAAALCLCAAALARADGNVRLKIATLAPKGSIYHRVLQEVSAAVISGEGPGTSAAIYTDGSQGGEADVVRRMRVGQLNAALLSTVGLSEIDASVSVLQKLPLLFRSTDEVEYVGRALRSELERRLSDKGFVAILWGEAGWVRFFAKQPLALPGDLKTRRLFAWAGDPEQVELMKQLGYHPVVLETADVIPGLETGLVDAVPLTPIFALATQVDGLAPHMVDLRWAPITGALLMTRSTWDALRPATQAAVRQVAERGSAELAAYQERADADAIAAMQKRGLKVDHLNEAQEREWYAFAAQIYPLLRGHTVPADTFDAAVRLLEEYRGRAAAVSAGR